MGKAGGDVLHCNAVRLRVIGSGNLLPSLWSLDNVRNVDLFPHPMSYTTNREPIVLANFNEQRIQLKVMTTQINETFMITKMVIFVKPVAEGYPVV